MGVETRRWTAAALNVVLIVIAAFSLFAAGAAIAGLLI